MEKERQIEFDKKQQAKNQQQFQPQQSQMEKDPDVNENQIERLSERKDTISLIQSDQNTQANPNIDLNYIRETLAILRTISHGDPRGNKEREPEPKKPKLQQYAGLIDVIERFHEIMKPIIEKRRRNPKLYYQHNTNITRTWTVLFSSIHLRIIARHQFPDRMTQTSQKNSGSNLMGTANLSKGSYIPGLLNVRDGIAGFINMHLQINQSIPDAVIGLIIFAAEQIVQSETESEDQEQLINELERIVADGTDYNEDNDQFQHAIELKHFTNGNDGLRENDSWMKFLATVNGQANPDINITKLSTGTPFHNVNGSDGLGGNGCGTQLHAATNENGHKNHQAIDNTGNESNNKQKNDNRTGGQQQYNQVSNNETQYEQDSVNNKPEEKGSPQTTHSEQELRNPNISQPKGQLPLITTSPELGQVKGKVIVPRQRISSTSELDTRSKTGLSKSIPKKSFWRPKARAKTDPTNHYASKQERRKKANVALFTEVMYTKRLKGNKTSAGSKKQKQGFNSENQVKIELDSETDQSDQLD
ncbi:MAG: hypothetical protein EZS28_016159 [Streblomastix strix]|uniref:Uncharacterized protein n=1 Tax=Streblomastix strix TaxID=222440 RepID=A0A5J4W0J7_9EUKA|nr:MAG: hypothetical protein EZS28_016159 [Streblomastix strix]